MEMRQWTVPSTLTMMVNVFATNNREVGQWFMCPTNL
jgi:hypothetical protein